MGRSSTGTGPSLKGALMFVGLIDLSGGPVRRVFVAGLRAQTEV